MNKVLQIDKHVDSYIKLADERVANEDLLGALFALKSAINFSRDVNILVRIADVYADMGLIELSNRYWFKYMLYAPKDKVSLAYEELGINCFYMDNLWATGYYFHKKIETDGVISKEGIDKEIIDFLSGDEFKKHAYRIVYPIEKADFSLEIKNAKRAIGLGAFSEAVTMLEKIPEQVRTAENSDDLTVAYFMNDQLDEAEKESRRSIETYGESVNAYCNLSTVYELKKNAEKSEYYYQKALSLTTGERTESYKILTCAIERKDHVIVKKSIETVIDERPYEVSMLFFKGIAHLNLGEYALAVQALKKAYSLDNDDVISEYYYELAKKFEHGEGEEKLLPLSYERKLPKKVESRWNARIRYLLVDTQKFVSSVKNPENIRLFRWCLQHGSYSVMRSLAYNLATLSERTFYKLALELLMLPEIGETQKRLMIYLLSLCGYKGKVGVAFGVLFQSYQAKKLACEKDLDNPRFLTAYALCMSKYVFSDVEDVERIAKVTDKIYFGLKDQLDESVTIEEIACLITIECNFKNHNDLKRVCSKFNAQVTNVNRLKEKLHRGEQ